MPKAILSVYDKTGLPEFAAGLVESGWTLLASGGTARLLRQNGLPVIEVATTPARPKFWGAREDAASRHARWPAGPLD